MWPSAHQWSPLPMIRWTEYVGVMTQRSSLPITRSGRTGCVDGSRRGVAADALSRLRPLGGPVGVAQLREPIAVPRCVGRRISADDLLVGELGHRVLLD